MRMRMVGIGVAIAILCVTLIMPGLLKLIKSQKEQQKTTLLSQSTEDREIYTTPVVVDSSLVVVSDSSKNETHENLTLNQDYSGFISGKVVGKRFMYEPSPRLKHLMEQDDSEMKRKALSEIGWEDLAKEETTLLPDVTIILKQNDAILTSTITDMEGCYSFGNLPQGNYSVLAEIPENAARTKEDQPGEVRNVALNNAAMTDVDFEFILGGTYIRGRVTDTGGNPIKGAKVLGGFYRLPNDYEDHVVGWEGTPPPRWQAAVSAISDENGYYQLNNLYPDSFFHAAGYLMGGGLKQTYEIRARADGYISARTTVPPFTENILLQGFSFLEDTARISSEVADNLRTLRRGLPDVVMPEGKGDIITAIDLILKKESYLTGRILDARDRTIPAFADQTLIRMIRVNSSEDHTKDSYVDQLGWIASHDGGKFEYKRIPPGVYTFEIQSAVCGYMKAINEPLEIREGAYLRDVEVLVETTGTISGKVLDASSGNPVSEFSIQISTMDSQQTAPIYRQAEIDKSQPGIFTIEKLFPGSWSMKTNAPDYLPQEIKVVILSGQTTERIIELEHTGTISGRVVDAKSEVPVETFTVKILNLVASGDSLSDHGRIIIDETQKGTFVIEGISPGRATLLIESPGYARKEAEVEVMNGEKREETFYLDEEAYVYGDISLNSNPRDAQISIHITGQKMKDWGYLNSKNAHYEVKGLKQGDYTIGAAFHFEGRHATWWLMDRKNIYLEGGDKTRLDFHFQGTSAIKGRVTWSDSLDASYEQGSLRPFILVLDNGLDPSLPQDERIRANAYKMERYDGLYEISSLPAASYTVIGMLRKEEDGKIIIIRKEEKTVVLEEGQVSKLDFTFP